MDIVEDYCPDCCRNKAHTAEEVMWGYCEKWWAIRDPDAEISCKQIASRIKAKIEAEKTK